MTDAENAEKLSSELRSADSENMRLFDLLKASTMVAHQTIHILENGYKPGERSQLREKIINLLKIIENLQKNNDIIKIKKGE